MSNLKMKVMSIKKLFSTKFSEFCDLPCSENYFTFKVNGKLYEVIVSRYHFYYLFVKCVGSEFPFFNCRVKGSQCLNDFKF